MAIDLKLSDTYDLEIVEGDLTLVTEGDEVAQSTGIRLLFIQGEWYFDYTLGIPWFESMFTTVTSYEQKAKILKDTIRNTQGVNQILTFEFGVDPVAHRAEIEFDADTTFGVVSLKVGA